MRHSFFCSRLSTILIAATTWLPAPARAGTLAKSPSEACAFLRDLGLSAGAWKNHYDDVYGCSSPYRELGSGYPLANNLAYYVDGKKTSVSLVKLVLNVNDRSDAKAAHLELLKAARALSHKAAGEGLPEELEAAIRDGKRASARVRATQVEIIRENWPTGKGYEIKVVFK